MSEMLEELARAADDFERRAEHPLSSQIEDLFLGMRCGSALILDNIGITLIVAKLPGYSARKRAYRELVGVGCLSRFWCRAVRPRLFPKRHDALVEAWDSARLQVRAEMLNSIIRQGEEMLDERQAE